jgi:hypothetical protein
MNLIQFFCVGWKALFQFIFDVTELTKESDKLSSVRTMIQTADLQKSKPGRYQLNQAASLLIQILHS